MNGDFATSQPQTYLEDSQQEISAMLREMTSEEEFREMNGNFVTHRDYEPEFREINGNIVNYRPQTFSLATIVDVVKKTRGHPKGSKNKPKAALPLVHRDRGDAMAPYIVEVTDGNDIVQAISQFSIRKNISVCLLTASGTAANAFLSLSSMASTPHIICTGHHAILSLSAAIGFTQYPTSGDAHKALIVSLATTTGNVIGGLVVGLLVSKGPVYVIATSFNRSCHRLSDEDEEKAPKRARNTATGEQKLGTCRLICRVGYLCQPFMGFPLQ